MTLQHETASRDEAVSKRLWELVNELEAEGFGIFAGKPGTGHLIRMSDLPTPDNDALMRFNVAVRRDPALKAALGPFLWEHRPLPIEADHNQSGRQD